MISTQVFADKLQSFIGRTAVITSDGREFSYVELSSLADSVASDWGDERRLVLVEASNDIEPLAAYLGALRHRHPVIIAAPGASEEDMRILDKYKPDIVFKRSEGRWRSVYADTPPVGALHEDLAVLLSTSGSTGDPKLVRLSRRNIESNAHAISEYLALNHDRAITSLPWHYSYGMSVVNSYLASGGALLLTEHSVIDDAFWDFFSEHCGTSLAGVPHTFELLERIGFRDRSPPETLRYMTSAGGRLDRGITSRYAEWAHEHGRQFFVMYGQTEAAPRMAYLPPDLARAHPDCIGIPIPGGSFRLIEQNGEEISEPDHEGELVYAGPNVMMGYATAREDLARGDDTPELHTGDLACRTKDGLYRITGRANRFSKLFGLRINLDEVERFLAEEGHAARVSGNDTAIAICVTGDADPVAVENALARRYHLPRTAIVAYHATECPLLPTGKIDNRAILANALSLREERLPRSSAAEGATAVEGEGGELGDDLVGDISRLLGGVEIGPNDSFVTLGGDSLSFVEASLLIEERLGVLPERWEQLPIAELERQRQTPRVARLDAAEEQSGGGVPMDTEIVLRAAAILGVVITHVQLLPIGGGAFLLLVLAGFAFARFQHERLVSGRVVNAVAPFLGKILIVYYAVLILYAVIRGGVDLQHWLLVANFFPALQAAPGLLPFYWFVENLTQIVILFSLLFLVPQFRNAMRKSPFASGVALLCVAFLLSLASRTLVTIYFDERLLDEGEFFVRTPLFTLYLFVFGWCMFFVSNNAQRYVLTAASAFMFWFVADDGYSVWLIAGTLTVLWMPRIVVIAPVRLIASTIAAATFYIFLVHLIPVQIVLYGFATENALARFAAVVAGVLLGIGTAKAVRWGEGVVTAHAGGVLPWRPAAKPIRLTNGSPAARRQR